MHQHPGLQGHTAALGASSSAVVGRCKPWCKHARGMLRKVEAAHEHYPSTQPSHPPCRAQGLTVGWAANRGICLRVGAGCMVVKTMKQRGGAGKEPAGAHEDGGRIRQTGAGQPSRWCWAAKPPPNPRPRPDLTRNTHATPNLARRQSPHNTPSATPTHVVQQAPVQCSFTSQAPGHPLPCTGTHFRWGSKSWDLLQGRAWLHGGNGQCNTRGELVSRSARASAEHATAH